MTARPLADFVDLAAQLRSAIKDPVGRLDQRKDGTITTYYLPTVQTFEEFTSKKVGTKVVFKAFTNATLSSVDDYGVPKGEMYYYGKASNSQLLTGLTEIISRINQNNSPFELVMYEALAAIFDDTKFYNQDNLSDFKGVYPARVSGVQRLIV